jgi:hypothetical protein
MREMGLGVTATSGTRRSASRTYSYQNLLGAGTSSAGAGPSSGVVVTNSNGVTGQGQEDSLGVGLVKGRNGPMVVARGGWKGKSPFELSVERCMAQRPQRALGM